MSVGAKDYIDQMLVKKYAKERMNNTTEPDELVRSPETYWRYAKEVAEVKWSIVKVTSYLKKQKDNQNQNKKKQQQNEKKQQDPQSTPGFKPAFGM